MKVAVVNLKGGTGKTTTSVYAAAGLGQRGRVLLIDADPQGSALSWSETASSFPVTTVGLPVRDLHRRVNDLGRDYDHVVIDTPPGDLAIVRGALLAAEVALIPIPASLIDLDRLRPTIELVSEAEDINGLDLRVVLTRVRIGTRSAAAAREVLSELGLPVLAAEVPLREAIAMSFGLEPDDLREYGAVLDELALGVA